MKARLAGCCTLFSGQDMSLLLIQMKLVVPTATANDNTATALLTAAQLLHGINGCKYLYFVMPEALNVMQQLGVDGCSWYLEAALTALSRRDQSEKTRGNSEENELLQLSALENETIQSYLFNLFVCL